MRAVTRGRLVWPATILAGLALGGYVFAAWPDTTPRLVPLPYGEAMPKTPTAKSQPVRVMASAGVDPESELAGVAYPEELFVYEPGQWPLLDAIIAAPEPVDAH